MYMLYVSVCVFAVFGFKHKAKLCPFASFSPLLVFPLFEALSRVQNGIEVNYAKVLLLFLIKKNKPTTS